MDGAPHRAITKSRRSGYDPIADIRSTPLLLTALRPNADIPEDILSSNNGRWITST